MFDLAHIYIRTRTHVCVCICVCAKPWVKGAAGEVRFENAHAPSCNNHREAMLEIRSLDGVCVCVQLKGRQMKSRIPACSECGII